MINSIQISGKRTDLQPRIFKCRCKHCGQLFSFEKKYLWRKTYKKICPVCKKDNLVIFDRYEECFRQLEQYENTGCTPEAFAKMSVLYHMKCVEADQLKKQYGILIEKYNKLCQPVQIGEKSIGWRQAFMSRFLERR